MKAGLRQFFAAYLGRPLSNREAREVTHEYIAVFGEDGCGKACRNALKVHLDNVKLFAASGEGPKKLMMRQVYLNNAIFGTPPVVARVRAGIEANWHRLGKRDRKAVLAYLKAPHKAPMRAVLVGRLLHLDAKNARDLTNSMAGDARRFVTVASGKRRHGRRRRGHVIGYFRAMRKYLFIRNF